MNLSYNWLKDYVDHQLQPEELSDLLTMSGLEVEGVEVIGNSMEGVVVGHVLSVSRHPNADRLSCCVVDVAGEEPLPIVCGAPNVAAGQRVPVATVGTRLMLPGRENPDEKVEVKIKKSKIRGEESRGMICAEDELGLSDNHDGIMVLDGEAKIGQAFSSYLEERSLSFQDHVIDVSITPNRPDAISHIGASRDVAAIVNTPLLYPEVDVPNSGGDAQSLIDVEIEAPEACRRYAAMVVQGITVKESPAWLKQRLTAIGLRPRNNMVDITNYVMYECGQPLHAFDYDQIAGKKIIVRFNKGGEKFTTLDSKERELPDNTLMICDGDRPVALAGIMGGENSEVTDQTVNVLIESAYFDPSTIRKTAKALSLQTDASYRFERGVDSNGQVWAAARAAALMAELGGGTIVSGVQDEHPSPITPPVVAVRHKRIETIVGRKIDAEEVVRLLSSIGFKVEDKGGSYTCAVPSFRPDVEREIDVIEEVARLSGYHNIPEPAHTVVPSLTPRVNPELVLRRQVKTLLLGLGFRETYTNSMLRKEVAETFNVPVLTGGEGDVVETLKPISQEMAALRPSLLPGLLSVIGYNQNRGQRSLRLMEFGKVFQAGMDSNAFVPGYKEHTSLILCMCGPLEQVHWSSSVKSVTFHDLKGVVEALLQNLCGDAVEMKPVYDETPVTAYHLALEVKGTPVGVIAAVSESQQKAYSLRDPVYVAELNWGALLPHLKSPISIMFSEFSRFPVVERDLAIQIDQSQAVGDLMQDMERAGGKLLKHIHVFDVYEGEQVETGKKSIAFGLRFGAGRTLKDKEVDRSVESIVKSLNKNFGAELRK
ncbi:MAG: phenylalanine--tRNA ligase subunit beta [Rhodothermaceae bacterium]|nr:phenylalanine--tRNA ligase subunit beta [Rhodothermaceae bacterium]